MPLFWNVSFEYDKALCPPSCPACSSLSLLHDESLCRFFWHFSISIVDIASGFHGIPLKTDWYSFLPVALCASRAIFTPLSRYSTTLTKSASLKLRDVKAGAPTKQRTEWSTLNFSSLYHCTVRQASHENKENHQLKMLSWYSTKFSELKIKELIAKSRLSCYFNIFVQDQKHVLL